MFLFFLPQTDDHVLKNYIYFSQLCRKQNIINIITNIRIVTIILLLKLMWHFLFFTFLNVKTLKTSYFTKKISIFDKSQWSHEKCSYFPIQRLDCSCFFVYLRPAYVLKMFLFLKKNKPLCSYKHGSYKKKRVVGLWANLEDVRLDLNHSKSCTGKWLLFGGTFGVFWVLVESRGVMGG